MHWARFAFIVVGTGFVTSMTDWFFAGDWIHRRFTYPEVWRQQSETKAILVSSVLSFLTCGVFVYLLARVEVHSVTAQTSGNDTPVNCSDVSHNCRANSLSCAFLPIPATPEGPANSSAPCGP